MYNEWAQKNAVNLNGPNASEAAQTDFVPRNDSEAIALAAASNIRSKHNIETALRNNATALPRPSVGLISSAEVSGYPYVDRYLGEQLGDKDVTHYYILREDYEFKNLSGESVTIPAGFLWDGASISKAVAFVALEVGNTRYNSALSEGLIHDFMYRDPRRFSKEEADDLFYVNLVRCGNADPKKIYKGVQLFGGDSYQGHKRRQNQGLYDVFTPEFYANNLKLYQCSIDTSKLEALLKEQIAFDLSLLQKGEKATTSEIANHNSRNDKIFQELVSICKKIDEFKLSDEEKVQKLKDTLTPIMDKYATNSKSITQKLVDSKIVERLQSPSFNPGEVVDVGFLNSDAAKARRVGQP